LSSELKGDSGYRSGVELFIGDIKETLVSCVIQLSTHGLTLFKFSSVNVALGMSKSIDLFVECIPSETPG